MEKEKLTHKDEFIKYQNYLSMALFQKSLIIADFVWVVINLVIFSITNDPIALILAVVLVVLAMISMNVVKPINFLLLSLLLGALAFDNIRFSLLNLQSESSIYLLIFLIGIQQLFFSIKYLVYFFGNIKKDLTSPKPEIIKEFEFVIKNIKKAGDNSFKFQQVMTWPLKNWFGRQYSNGFFFYCPKTASFQIAELDQVSVRVVSKGSVGMPPRLELTIAGKTMRIAVHKKELAKLEAIGGNE